MRIQHVASCLLTSVIALLLTGCHSVSPAVTKDAGKLSGKKNMYIVRSEGKERGFYREIERNLRSRGFTVSSGSLSEMGADAELYLKYKDEWHWDLAMYPRDVKIEIFDAKTKELLGSSEFKTGFFHTFADPPEITDELIGRIFGEPEGSHMK